MADTLNIYQRINAVMKQVKYAKKDAVVSGGGANYKGITHDFVLSIVRPYMVEYGIVTEPTLIADKWSEPRKGAANSTNWLYEACYDVAFVNIDKPEDRAVVRISGHANDSGDKAPGKAVSYAVKMAMLKVFGIETGENEESRTYDKGEFSDEVKDQFDDFIATENAFGMYCLSQLVGPDIFTGLYNSFPDGQKVKGKRKCDDLVAKGRETLDGYISSVSQLCDARDPAAAQVFSECNDTEKKFVWRGLVKHQQAYLRELAKENDI